MRLTADVSWWVMKDCFPCWVVYLGGLCPTLINLNQLFGRQCTKGRTCTSVVSSAPPASRASTPLSSVPHVAARTPASMQLLPLPPPMALAAHRSDAA